MKIINIWVKLSNGLLFQTDKMNKKIIAVCRSGARSGQATSFLKQQGIDVINGGPWQNVAKFVK